METLDHLTQTLALSMGAAWASGINLYATVFMLGFLANTGAAHLPPDLQILADPVVIAVAALMYFVEFFMDKIPGVDTGWDVLHTFIRIPAGALLAAGAVADVGAAPQLAAALIGGSLAASTHATKAGTRVLINTSPEPFSNWAASITEDVAVIAGMWTAIQHPLLFLVLLVLFLLLLAWLLPHVWMGIKGLWNKLRRLFGAGKPENESPADTR